MLSIALHNIRLHGKHGLYPEEAITGNEFAVDVEVRLPAAMDDEWPFVDYAVLYSLTEEVFATPTKLLETLVKEIYSRVKKYAPAEAKLHIAIRKLSPPIVNAAVESAAVTFTDPGF